MLHFREIQRHRNTWVARALLGLRAQNFVNLEFQLLWAWADRIFIFGKTCHMFEFPRDALEDYITAKGSIDHQLIVDCKFPNSVCT